MHLHTLHNVASLRSSLVVYMRLKQLLYIPPLRRDRAPFLAIFANLFRYFVCSTESPVCKMAISLTTRMFAQLTFLLLIANVRLIFVTVT